MIKTLRQRCLGAIKHPATILLWPMLIVYLLTAKGHLEISDTDYSLRTARALVEDGTLLIAVSDTRDVSHEADLKKILKNYDIAVAVSAPSAIASAIKQYYG